MILREMRGLAPAHLPTEAAPLSVSFLIPARNAGPELLETVRHACAALERDFGESYEVILIPNPGEGQSATEDQSVEVANSALSEFPRVRVCPHRGTAGKGAALRTGFLNSQGAWIFFTDADLPYSLSFFTRAGELLRSGVDFVTGNRRLPLSQFEVPVTLLPLAYGRHRLGLWFNQLVRLFLPIGSTDTQAGIKAMTREFASVAFQRQVCPGFFFDIEFFLTCAAQGYQHADLTVELFLRSEKSTVRVLRQSILAGYWLARITTRHWTGAYGRARKHEIVGRFAGGDFFTRLFLWARWRLTPYSQMARWLPREGRILDLGCGHGLLSIFCALASTGRFILGVDHDERRISLAKTAVQDLVNLEFRVGPVLPMPEERNFAGVTMIDVFHYFPPSEQTTLAREAFERLESGGILLVREVEPHPQGLAALVASWNRLYERIATWIGFTRSQEESLYFRSPVEWEALFQAAGFHVRSKRCSSRIFSDVLFICKKPAPQIPGRPA